MSKQSNDKWLAEKKLELTKKVNGHRVAELMRKHDPKLLKLPNGVV